MLHNTGDFDIFLATYQKENLVCEVIERIYRHTTIPFSLIIVDNNSGPKMAHYLDRLRLEKDNVTIVRNQENLFACAATNQALMLCRSKYAVYLCSRECYIIEKGWESDCIEYMDEHPRVGIAGHVIESPEYYNGRTYMAMPFFRKFRNKEFARNNLDRPFGHVQGGFYIIRMEMVKRIGFFNENLKQDYMDVEYSYFVESMGWQLGDIPSVVSLSAKTRPNIEGYSKSVKVYHPLTVGKARKFERIKANTGEMSRPNKSNLIKDILARYKEWKNNFGQRFEA